MGLLIAITCILFLIWIGTVAYHFCAPTVSEWYEKLKVWLDNDIEEL